jgi:hypothetical protein
MRPSLAILRHIERFRDSWHRKVGQLQQLQAFAARRVDGQQALQKRGKIP